MSGSLNTHGIKAPETPDWKLFEHEGFQVLTYIEADEDDEDRYNVVFEGPIKELGATVSMKLGGPRKVADMIFAETSEAPKVIQAWLDYVGPVVSSMLHGEPRLPEGVELSEVVYDDATRLRFG